MKYVKIFLVASLALFGLASCGGDDAGVVGDATVEFYSDNLEGGFASDYLMVPIKLTDDEARTADVTLTVKAKEYTGAFAGVVDEDFMLTTENMVFKPGVDSINLEVMVLNKNVDELRFMLEIAESNATTGQVKEVLVSLAKTDKDRICTTWEWNFSKWTSLTSKSDEAAAMNMLGATAKVSWDSKYEEINITGFQGWWTSNGLPLIFGYDDEINAIVCSEKNGTWYTGYYYDDTNDIYEIWFNIVDGKIEIINEVVVATPNDDFTELNFSSDAYMVVASRDSSANMAIRYVFSQAYAGLQLLKPTEAAVAAKSVVPAKSAKNNDAVKAYPKKGNISAGLTDYERVELERQLNEHFGF
ncbi:MAG: hypothetical protein IJ979_02370 [Tidjanibacter sp.]|nr:hypothetical protein [Tidjanibacter sp.]MBR4063842.1 hypothetical protein [Tidjanibacter sp.]MBR6813584.1 hypothetical protein [Tidjanibacter sp.]MBR7102760.1 hypothetical protein [Tidjanibacter sp.]